MCRIITCTTHLANLRNFPSMHTPYQVVRCNDPTQLNHQVVDTPERGFCDACLADIADMEEERKRDVLRREIEERRDAELVKIMEEEEEYEAAYWQEFGDGERREEGEEALIEEMRMALVEEECERAYVRVFQDYDEHGGKGKVPVRKDLPRLITCIRIGDADEDIDPESESEGSPKHPISRIRPELTTYGYELGPSPPEKYTRPAITSPQSATTTKTPLTGHSLISPLRTEGRHLMSDEIPQPHMPRRFDHSLELWEGIEETHRTMDLIMADSKAESEQEIKGQFESRMLPDDGEGGYTARAIELWRRLIWEKSRLEASGARLSGATVGGLGIVAGDLNDEPPATKSPKSRGKRAASAPIPFAGGPTLSPLRYGGNSPTSNDDEDGSTPRGNLPSIDRVLECPAS